MPKAKKSVKKGSKAKLPETKRVELTLAPAVFALLSQERETRNSSPSAATETASYSDIVEEALEAYLPAVDRE